MSKSVWLVFVPKREFPHQALMLFYEKVVVDDQPEDEEALLSVNSARVKSAGSPLGRSGFVGLWSKGVKETCKGPLESESWISLSLSLSQVGIYPGNDLCAIFLRIADRDCGVCADRVVRRRRLFGGVLFVKKSDHGAKVSHSTGQRATQCASSLELWPSF